MDSLRCALVGPDDITVNVIAVPALEDGTPDYPVPEGHRLVVVGDQPAGIGWPAPDLGA